MARRASPLIPGQQGLGANGRFVRKSDIRPGVTPAGPVAALSHPPGPRPVPHPNRTPCFCILSLGSLDLTSTGRPSSASSQRSSTSRSSRSIASAV